MPITLLRLLPPAARLVAMTTFCHREPLSIAKERGDLVFPHIQEVCHANNTPEIASSRCAARRNDNILSSRNLEHSERVR